MYDLTEDKGNHVRLDGKGVETRSNMHDVRAAAAPLALQLKWITFFSNRFFAGKHINLLQLESLISRSGIREKTTLGTCGRRFFLKSF